MASTGTPSPAVARRRVSLALRRAREAKNWTQTQVANAMEWSLSKVMRIEKGQVNISPSDLRAVLQLLDITDTAEVDELLADARVSRAERYTIDDGDRAYLTPAMIRMFQYEVEANSILYYSDVVVPGPLQTPEYARAVLAHHNHRLDDTTIDARLSSRLRRRDRVLRRPEPPEYRLILDEAVLRRPMGGSAVMAEQLKDLLQMSRSGQIRIRIAPFSDSPLVFLGPFTIVDIRDGGRILYRESAMGDEIVDVPEVVDVHREVFDLLWPSILDEEASQRFIELAITGSLWSHP